MQEIQRYGNMRRMCFLAKLLEVNVVAIETNQTLAKVECIWRDVPRRNIHCVFVCLVKSRACLDQSGNANVCVDVQTH